MRREWSSLPFRALHPLPTGAGTPVWFTLQDISFAEGEGFGPPSVLPGTAFGAGAIGLSANLPRADGAGPSSSLWYPSMIWATGWSHGGAWRDLSTRLARSPLQARGPPGCLVTGTAPSPQGDDRRRAERLGFGPRGRRAGGQRLSRAPRSAKLRHLSNKCAPEAGFDPATSTLGPSCSVQLSYSGSCGARPASAGRAGPRWAPTPRPPPYRGGALPAGTCQAF